MGFGVLQKGKWTKKSRGTRWRLSQQQKNKRWTSKSTANIRIHFHSKSLCNKAHTTTILNRQIIQLNSANKNNDKQRQIQHRRPHEEETGSQVYQTRRDHAALRCQERLHEILQSLAVSNLIGLTWTRSDNYTARLTGCWTKITSVSYSPRRSPCSSSQISSWYLPKKKFQAGFN